MKINRNSFKYRFIKRWVAEFDSPFEMPRGVPTNKCDLNVVYRQIALVASILIYLIGVSVYYLVVYEGAFWITNKDLISGLSMTYYIGFYISHVIVLVSLFLWVSWLFYTFEHFGKWFFHQNILN